MDEGAEIMSAAIEPIPRTRPRPDETRSLPEIGGIGIAGVDLSGPLSRNRDARLMRTVRAHLVIAFRDPRKLRRTLANSTIPY
jgi:hypothetical protein